MSGCAHKWVSAGVCYRNDTWPLPGTGACARYYYDAFYCEHCAEQLLKRERQHGDTYRQPLPNTWYAGQRD